MSVKDGHLSKISPIESQLRLLETFSSFVNALSTLVHVRNILDLTHQLLVNC